MIIENQKSKKALNVQKKIGMHDFPFTLNPFIGCLMQCTYCFSPRIIIKRERSDFFQNVDVKPNFVELVEKDLKKFSSLPQHLKRVQMGETTELFQPKVLSYMKKNLGYDLNGEIFKVFKEQWDKGNYWMLHILTKNHNILSHLPLLKDIREMVQIEFSMIHHDDAISRQYEKYTSSIPKRLDAIERLSAEGIFVRVMAMPFYGNQNDLQILKDITFNAGAQAFKNKGINYYDWFQLNQTNPLDPLSRTGTKNNNYDPNFIIKSYEEVSPRKTKIVRLPKFRKRGDNFINWSVKPNEGLEDSNVTEVDMGYSSINNIDWGYIK